MTGNNPQMSAYFNHRAEIYNGVNELDEIKLHPHVTEFKQFINERPTLIKEIRKSGKSLQEYYEKWYIDGNAGFVQKFDYKKQTALNKDYSDLWASTLKYIDQLDIAKVQYYLNQLGNLVTTVQFMLGNVADHDKTNSSYQQGKQLFDVFRD